MRRFIAALCLLSVAGLSVGCGNNNDQTAPANNPIVALTISPATANVAPGSTQQFIATGTLSNGQTVDYTDQVTWTSSNSGVAVISSFDEHAGQASALTVGTVSISATTGAGQIASATLNVGQAAFAITPNNLQLGVGQTTQLAATSTTAGVVQDLTGATSFSSSNPAVATVTTGGFVTGVSGGTAVITGSTTGGLVSTSTVVVGGAVTGLNSLIVSPAIVNLSTGGTAQLTTFGTFSNGSSSNLTSQVTYASSNPAVATVSPTGVVTATGGGQTTITASSGGQTSTSSVNVAP